MNRIESMFQSARAERRKLLMPFVCAGDPAGVSLETLLPRLEHAGASAVEIGVPFSDPIADGPTIAHAMHEALGRGVTPRGVLDDLANARAKTEMGLVLMLSVSLVTAAGVEAFMRDAKDAGADGLIIPDAPYEESEGLAKAAADKGLTLSLLVAPTTPEDRAAAIVSRCTGFVYLLARAGITGERSDVPEIGERVAMIRRSSRLPIACGFGISTPEQVEAVVRHADAAIVGSALVRRMAESKAPIDAAEEFVTTLSTGLVTMDSI